MITVVCVRTGTKYGIGYVKALSDMVDANLQEPHKFLCLTDQPETVEDVDFVDISEFGLPSWFAKMLIFNRPIVGSGKILYIDLDTVINGDLSPLANLRIDFGICQNFTRILQARYCTADPTFPCLYGSCVMVLGNGFGREIWSMFWRDRDLYIGKARITGDQQIIQWIHPGAKYLQHHLPENYFLHYKDFTDEPRDSEILVFGGKSKPANCEIEWINKLIDKANYK